MKDITVIRTMDGKEPTFTKSQKFFKLEDDEMCYSIEHFQDIMRDNGLTEMEVFKAVIHSDRFYFWCKSFREFIERHDICGKDCDFYSPRNGKSGCCVHQVNGYQAGEKVTIKLNNKKP